MMITKTERYREILIVLARHGIGVVDDQVIKHEASDQARPEHLRRACEELGTTFIKLGQLLSTRSDLLPEAYRTELAKLQNEVPPLPEEVIANIIREELEAPPDKLFAFLDPKPLGSASIGQVHAARLFDGREVVVKVRKPGVDELVQVDLEIMGGLIDEWSPHFPVLVQYDARGLHQYFGDTLRAELDYSREAENVKLFQELFKNELGFKIPGALDEYSKGRVLTEERVKGRKASDITDLPKPRRMAIARRIARFVLEPAFENGVFHADPHAGNLIIQEDDSLSVIDFGKVGRLTPELRRHVADIFVAIERSDAQRLTDVLIEIAAPTIPIDHGVIATEIDRMLELYINVSLQQLRFSDAISELLQLVRRHALHLPAHLVLFFKALAMSEGLLQTIDPDSRFSDYLKPLVAKVLYQRFSPKQGFDRLRDSALDAVELGIELPRRIDRVLGEIERGNLRVWTRIEDVEPLMKRFEHMVARTNTTMLASASIVGLSVIMLVYHPHGWQLWIGVVFWIASASVIIDSIRTLLGLRKK
jgi:ubiquinone biosynthesis protein